MYSFRMATDVFFLLLLLHFGRSLFDLFCQLDAYLFHSDYFGCIDNSAKSVSIQLGRLIYALPTIK